MNRSIEVRTLAGESTAVSISPNLSVADLKAALRKSFPPAEISPNFHLFFKGARLRIDTRIDSDQIENGDFMVLVPFTKKIKEISSHNDTCTQCSTPSFTSPAANSAWHDLMNDLSSLSERWGELGSEKGEAFVVESPAKLASLATKRKRDDDSSHALRDILCSDAKDGFDQQTRDKICHFVDLVNCLSDSSTGHCLLLREFVKGSEEGKKCVCPLWLKKLLKTFTFLNIFYAFFHAQRKLMSRKVLTEALKNGSRFGLDDVSGSYVEKLSLLCPTMVVMLGKEDKMVTKQGSAIIICDSSSDSVDSCDMANKPRRQASILAAINGIEKRGISFRTDLWRLLENFMEKRLLSCSMPRMPSLEDLILTKNENVVPEHTKRKAVKHWSSPSKCHGTSRLEPTEMVDHLRKGMGIDGQIVHVEYIDAKQAVYTELLNDLSENTKEALKGIGISRLYCHQAEAICASLSGKNVVVATSTSSGKSLCYNLPVLEVLSKNPLACALYVFPTKALAQDQLRALCEMTSGLDVQLNVGVYDGDTSQEHRSWIRHNSRLLITNPDMLHMSILPYHAMFKRILSNLRIIVIDEAHVYKGAFGCHTALILRRLRRICFHVYGCDPSFIFSTATSANPREHALELANLQSLELIQNDGSPCGPKYFLMWNPPLRLDSVSSSGNGQEFENKELCTQRSSPILEASRLFAEMVQHGLRCITFCKTRKLCELVLCYTREILQEIVPNLVESICVYRGGYTHQDRRRIETEFFGGKLRGVAATNALELGIDVGHIDVTLHLGFPGSVASLWQQAGRSGRRLRPSLAIYIAFEGPLDQYFMKFPHKLFKRPVEHCHVDGQNQKVLEQHIACAALELPLCLQYDEKYFGSGLDSAITALKSIGYLNTDQFGAPSTNMWNYIGPQKRPSAAVTIRAIEADKYKVVDQVDNKVLEEIEESKAFFQVYEGAVYMHQGISYLVKTLDLSEKIATCQKADLKYYTRTRDYTDIHIIGGDLAYPSVNESEIEHTKTTAQVHGCKVTTNWFGFHCIWRSSNQIFDTVDLSLPNFSYESEAAWIRIPQSTKTAVQMQNLSFRAGMHAASHALLNVVPLYMLCNASDLGTECANPHETRNIPERLLLYDKHPGGIGISAQIRLLFRELLTASIELVLTCRCSNAAGCPNCVQAFLCSEYNEVLDKRAAIIILEGVIEAENSYFESSKPSKAPCAPN